MWSNSNSRFLYRRYLSNIYEKPLDFVIDACDTVTFKIHLIKYCLANKIPVISVMGSANKLDPTKFQITDISKTTVCPLAK